jgi:Ran GTPase-activating protein (RanGAP) involved in mRNA processing and transport
MNYSIEGLGLELNTREDIAPYLHQIEPNITQLEEILVSADALHMYAKSFETPLIRFS